MRSFTATATCLLPSPPSLAQPRYHSPSLPSLQRNAVNNSSSIHVRAAGDFSPFSGKSWNYGPWTGSYGSSFFAEGLSSIPKYSFKGSTKRISFAIIRCEQASGGGKNLSIWLGRLAMLGFVGVVGIEIITGKGVLQQVGINSPAPAAALALTAVIGIIAAVGIFRSAS